MGKKVGNKLKKGQKGEASYFLTRSNAIRRLQLNLKDFRRLCILKGIYPREAKKKLSGNDKTYFHIKDLKILEHDALLGKFRDIKSHLKKYKKYLGQKDYKRAQEHNQMMPKYSLTHVIRERYPSFIDALRDLDDALCLLSLFANFPQHQSLGIHAKEIGMAAKLYKEWMTYCTISQCFKKAFFSIKGIYYQVEIMGQNITWVAPYQFNQRLPFDIDYKIIGTFMEFYISLLRFVNFKLYKDLDMTYPPTNIKGVSSSVTDEEQYLDVQQIQKFQEFAQKKFNQQYTESVEQIGVSEEFKNTPEMIELTKKQEQLRRQRKLFSKCNFLFNRETPVYCLHFIALSFGAQYCTMDDLDANPDIKVTHHVMDRPLKNKANNREYVQPQYIADSINNLFLLPTAQYTPGTAPPPHLSPFIDSKLEGYIPLREKEILHLKGEEVIESDDDVVEEQEVVAETKPVAKKTEKKVKEAAGKGDADSSSGEESEEVDPLTTAASRKLAAAKLKKDLADEQKEMGKTLMTNRQRKLYQKHEEGEKDKKDKVQKLKLKRKAIEKSKTAK